ncbi:MAG TPA: Fe-S cluster assembly protein IscX [Candidatus Eisenbacteria bacterium]|nr:Fe-S cluster assembly protein IscX [Candidatus Eisenbacteria bacterium]
MELRWDDAEEIGEALAEAHPTVDPLGVRFTDMHRWICALPDFADDPSRSSEGALERIQMAWAEIRNEKE